MVSRLVIFLLLGTTLAFGAERGLKRHVQTPKDEAVLTYSGSYALLVGVSEYTGWPMLESIPAELQRLKAALETKGFTVSTIMNPRGRKLKYAFERFIDQYGYDKGNRLLFYFAGHGYTVDDQGFLVPADAPDPRQDLKNFKRKSLNMNSLLAMARRMDANHALFLFDSCFSGTIFKTRALPEMPPYIRQSMALPVRQFITAGTAGEAVPAKSTFTPMFIDAINGEADLNHDRYVTGSEVGIYLSQNLPNFERQHPQYGKINDYRLSRGDFIFFPATEAPVPAPLSTPKSQRGVTLTVKPEPADARVYIMNIKPRYRDGISLIPGSYDVKVVRDGYVTQRFDVPVRKNTVLEVRLEKAEKPTPPAAETAFWQEIRGIATVESYRDYLAAYPNGRFVPDARRALNVLEPAKSTSSFDNEEVAWDYVKGSQYGEDFERFLRRFPQSRYRALAHFKAKKYAENRKPFIEPAMVFIPPGSFEMGSTEGNADEQPVHTITFEQGFYMAAHEVTFDEYERFCKATDRPAPHDAGWGRGKRPVINVSWDDAGAYAEWLSSVSRRRYRLPGEAEWEYAARAGSETPYSFHGGTEVLCRHGNIADKTAQSKYRSWTVAPCDDGHLYTAPVGSFLPNAYGLYDLYGNVKEWCLDWYAPRYDATSPKRFKTLRGGSWSNLPHSVRSTARAWDAPHVRSYDYGFRLLRELP